MDKGKKGYRNALCRKAARLSSIFLALCLIIGSINVNMIFAAPGSGGESPEASGTESASGTFGIAGSTSLVGGEIAQNGYSEKSASSKKSLSVKTEDTTNIVPYVFAGIGAVLVIVILVITKLRKKKEPDHKDSEKTEE